MIKIDSDQENILNEIIDYLEKKLNLIQSELLVFLSRKKKRFYFWFRLVYFISLIGISTCSFIISFYRVPIEFVDELSIISLFMLLLFFGISLISTLLVHSNLNWYSLMKYRIERRRMKQIYIQIDLIFNLIEKKDNEKLKKLKKGIKKYISYIGPYTNFLDYIGLSAIFLPVISRIISDIISGNVFEYKFQLDLEGILPFSFLISILIFSFTIIFYYYTWKRIIKFEKKLPDSIDYDLVSMNSSLNDLMVSLMKKEYSIDLNISLFEEETNYKCAFFIFLIVIIFIIIYTILVSPNF